VGSTAISGYEKYLGLPAIIGRAKNAAFTGILGRAQAWLEGWKERMLSQVGKEILIKAVVQSIPTYSMSVFLIPKALCKKLNSMSNSFGWGKSKPAWLRWVKLGGAKVDGGLGFRDIEVFNIALLAKQGWRILQHPESRVGIVMKDKYFWGGTFLQAPLGSKPSYAWRSIIRARDRKHWKGVLYGELAMEKV
jgi:hypothetical protein